MFKTTVYLHTEYSIAKKNSIECSLSLSYSINNTKQGKIFNQVPIQDDKTDPSFRANASHAIGCFKSGFRHTADI